MRWVRTDTLRAVAENPKYCSFRIAVFYFSEVDIGFALLYTQYSGLAQGEGIMIYKVSDVSIEYEPGDEIIADRIEADTADAAILAALKAISPSMESFVADATINQPDDFAKYVLSAFVAEEVAP